MTITVLTKNTSLVCCSSPVTEDVPPRRDRFIHGVPPSVTGLVLSQSVPLHPTSVNGPVHPRSVHSVNTLYAYMLTHVCVLSWPYPAEFNQRNYVLSAQRNYVPSAHRNDGVQCTNNGVSFSAIRFFQS